MVVRVMEDGTSTPSAHYAVEAIPRVGEVITFNPFAGTVVKVRWEEQIEGATTHMVPTVFVDLGTF